MTLSEDGVQMQDVREVLICLRCICKEEVFRTSNHFLCDNEERSEWSLYKVVQLAETGGNIAAIFRISMIHGDLEGGVSVILDFGPTVFEKETANIYAQNHELE